VAQQFTEESIGQEQKNVCHKTRMVEFL